ncbi:M48 family metallopeptidase [Litorimonas taeanensis]|nr:M48 family metalloprotease [Litorimonas taeanensis]
MSLALVALAVSACAGLETQLPEIAVSQLNQEKLAQEKIALTEWDSMAERLLRVGRPILIANEALCPHTGQDMGILTHSFKTYDKRWREASARELGAGEEPSIFHIAIDGPAHKAGLRRGDIIRDENGRALDVLDIQQAMREKETLFIDRKGARLPLDVNTVEGCGYGLRLSQNADINAFADGRHITINTGMMEFAESDEELAMIVGHELAHNTMGHIRKIVSNMILSGFSSRYTRPFESEADYVGMYYAQRAGVNIESVESFWRRLAIVSPKGVGRAKTHPTFPDRFLRIAAAREEIKAKIAAGEPLYPNYRKEGASSSRSSAPFSFAPKAAQISSEEISDDIKLAPVYSDGKAPIDVSGSPSTAKALPAE